MLEVVVDFVKSSRKAIVAFVLAGLFAWLTKKGLTIDVEGQEALKMFFESLLVAVAVYLVPNKK